MQKSYNMLDTARTPKAIINWHSCHYRDWPQPQPRCRNVRVFITQRMYQRENQSKYGMRTISFVSVTDKWRRLKQRSIRVRASAWIGKNRQVVICCISLRLEYHRLPIYRRERWRIVLWNGFRISLLQTSSRTEEYEYVLFRCWAHLMRHIRYNEPK